MSHKLIYGTRNPAKIAQVQEALKDHNLEIVGLGEIDIDVIEDGATPEENARKKSIEYAATARKPVLSMDAALYFDGVELDQQPGLYVRRIPGISNATDGEVLQYYTQLINLYGGTLDGYWEFSFALGMPDGTSEAFVSKTARTFISKADSNTLPGYPLESLQLDPVSGRYITELTPEEQAAAWHETLGRPLSKFIATYYNADTYR